MPAVTFKTAIQQLVPRPVARLGHHVLKDGLVSTLWRARLRSCWAWREWRWGLDTGGDIDGSQLNHDADSFGYQPVPLECFEAAMRNIELRAGEDVFMDVGCGKGRAVLLAAMLPFRRVLGIELSPELCRIAQDNVARACRRLTCQHVEIVNADAREYPIPDDVTVLLLFNPFDEPVLQRVLDQLRQSLARRSRQVTIVYALPNCRRDPLLDVPWLELRHDLLTVLSDWLRLAIYQTPSA